MTEHFDAATFLPVVDTVFEVDVDGITVPLKLVEVSETVARGSLRWFSIFFHGPADAELTQGNFVFRHPQLETMTFFIVPIAGSNAERIIYQASFSRFEAEG